MKRKLALPLVAGLLLSAACQRETKNEYKVAAMKTDLNELTTLMAIPVAPKSVKWIQGTPGKGGPIGPNDATVTALFEFSDESMAALRQKLDAPADGDPIALNPKEVEELFAGVDTSAWERPSGRLVVVPGELHGASAFMKSPFLNGKAVVVKGHPNQVLVALFTS
jgi:hypothetical protein